MQHNLWISVSKFKSNLSIITNVWAMVLTTFIIIFLILSGFLFWQYSDQNNLFNHLSYALSWMISLVGLHDQNMTISAMNSSGELIKYSVNTYQTNSIIAQSITEEKNNIFIISMASVFVAFILTWVIFKLFLMTNNKDESTFIRGAKIITAQNMRKLIALRKETSNFLLGVISIPKSKLSRHIGFFGDTGVGKSVSIMKLLDVIRQNNEKAFIVDKSGEFIQHFYNPETDIILSPFDDRSAGWTPFYEAEDIQDFERLAKSFIPTVTGLGKDDHWPEASVTVLSWLMYQISTQIDNPTIDDLINVLIDKNIEIEENLLGEEVLVTKRKLYEILEGTLAELVIDPSSPDHASSVIASIAPKIRALFYLRGLEERERFSINDWVKDEDNKGWVFIRVSEDQLDAVNPIITAWIDTFIKGVISLPKSSTRIVHALIDELQSFEKINSLAKAAFEGRKHGLRLMVGFTSVMELISIYGEHSVKATLSMLNTKVIFTTSEPDAAEWNAKVLGEEDVKLANQSISAGTNDNVSMSEDRRKQFIVMPAEIQNLPDLTSYVKFSGDWPVTKIETKYVDRPIKSKHFIKRILPDPRLTKKSTIVEEDTDNEIIDDEEKFII